MKRQAGHGLETAVFWLVAALTALIPLAHNPTLLGPFTLPKVILLWLGAAGLLLIIGFDMIRTHRLILPRGPVGILPVVFLLLIGLATYASIYPLISVFGARGRNLGLISYGSAIILFFAAWFSVSPGRVIVLARFAASTAVPISLLAVAQRAGLPYPIDFSQVMAARAGSTIGNPNFLGIFLAMSLALTLGLSAADKPRYRMAWLISAASLMAGLAVTNSLGAWLAASVVLGLHGLREYGRGRTGPQRAGMIAITTIAYGSVAGWLLLKTDLIASLAERLAVWLSGLRLVAQAPLLGTGPQTMSYLLPGIQPAGLGSKVFPDAHNIFITLGATVGLPALAIFCTLVVLLLRSQSPTSDQRGQALYFSLKLSLSAFLIGHLFNPVSIAPLVLFWVTAGTVARAHSDPQKIEIRSPALGLAVAMVAIMLGIWFGSTGGRLWQAEKYIKLASRERNLRTALDYAETAQVYWPHYSLYGLFLFDRAAPYVKDFPDIAEAVSSSLDRTISNTRMDADAYYGRGALNKLLGQKEGGQPYVDQAVSDFRRSLDFNPVKLLAHYELAKLYLERGEKQKAARHLNLILNLTPASDERRPEIEDLLGQT